MHRTLAFIHNVLHKGRSNSFNDAYSESTLASLAFLSHIFTIALEIFSLGLTFV